MTDGSSPKPPLAIPPAEAAAAAAVLVQKPRAHLSNVSIPQQVLSPPAGREEAAGLPLEFAIGAGAGVAVVAAAGALVECSSGGGSLIGDRRSQQQKRPSMEMSGDTMEFISISTQYHRTYLADIFDLFLD